MVADKIKMLRESSKYTQSELAKKLGITRASVNAWEMGISVPSTKYIVELSQIFNVSTDFLLGVNTSSSISVSGLSDSDICIIQNLIDHLRNNKNNL